MHSVILLVAQGELVRKLLLEAYDLGMGNGDYTFIGVELIQNKGQYGDFSWYQPGDRRNKHAREMFESLMMVTVRVPTSPEYASFLHKVSIKSREEYSGTTTKADVSRIVKWIHFV